MEAKKALWRCGFSAQEPLARPEVCRGQGVAALHYVRGKVLDEIPFTRR